MAPSDKAHPKKHRAAHPSFCPRKGRAIRNILHPIILASALASKASAQVYNQGIVIYLNHNFLAGSNLFNNPLQTRSNNLSYLFTTNPIIGSSETIPGTPEGTTVSLWNPFTLSFTVTSTFTNGGWSSDLMLSPGIGALVVAPSPFAITILGDVLGHDGNDITNNDGIPLPPLYSGPNGVFLLGDKTPVADTGTDIFLNILGRWPYIGEQVIQISGASTYLGNGEWDSVPTLGVGDAAFLNVMSEPAPLLTVVYTNNQAIVSWPPSVSGWALQTNNNLAAGSWGNYAGSVVNNTVTNTLPAGNLFFRLLYP